MQGEQGDVALIRQAAAVKASDGLEFQHPGTEGKKERVRKGQTGTM
jgi:hypothetical protein